jgi:hypothetical protein
MREYESQRLYKGLAIRMEEQRMHPMMRSEVGVPNIGVVSDPYIPDTPV